MENLSELDEVKISELFRNRSHLLRKIDLNLFGEMFGAQANDDDMCSKEK